MDNKHQVQIIEIKLIKRVLRACIQENLLQYFVENNILTIELKKSNMKIVVEDVKTFALGKFKLNGEVFLYEGQSSSKLTSVINLLQLIQPELIDNTTNIKWDKFVAEVNNCLENDQLTTEQIFAVNQQLTQEISNSPYNSFIEFIALGLNTAEQLMFFERWSASGHPLHPCHRTKLGLTKEEYIKFSPEFDQNIGLSLIAIHNSLAHIESQVSDVNYHQWFAGTFPMQWQAWRIEMDENNLPINNYCPIFIHPWQYNNVISNMFSGLIQERKLILFENIKIVTQSSISFRTLISKENVYHPHIKLPVSIQSTRYFH